VLRAESGSYRPMNLPLCSNADLSDEGGASGGGASGDGASADGGDGGGREGDGGDLSCIRLALQLYAAHVYRLGTMQRCRSVL